MRRLTYLFILIALLSALAGCGKKEEPKKDVIKEASVIELATKFKDKESFVLYLGKTDCPACSDAVALITDIASESDVEITYVNYAEAAKDIKNVVVLTLLLDPVLETDQETKGKQIHTPSLFRIAEGEIVDHVSGYNAKTSPEGYRRVIAAK